MKSVNTMQVLWVIVQQSLSNCNVFDENLVGLKIICSLSCIMGVGRFSQSYHLVHNLHFWVKKARFVMISTPPCSHCLLGCDRIVSPIQMLPVSCVVINLPCKKKRNFENRKSTKSLNLIPTFSHTNFINQRIRATTKKIELSLFGYHIKGLNSPEQKAIATIIL